MKLQNIEMHVFHWLTKNLRTSADLPLYVIPSIESIMRARKMVYNQPVTLFKGRRTQPILSIATFWGIVTNKLYIALIFTVLEIVTNPDLYPQYGVRTCMSFGGTTMKNAWACGAVKSLHSCRVNSREYTSWLYDGPEERVPSSLKGIGKIDRFCRIISFEKALAQ